MAASFEDGEVRYAREYLDSLREDPRTTEGERLEAYLGWRAARRRAQEARCATGDAEAYAHAGGDAYNLKGYTVR